MRVEIVEEMYAWRNFGGVRCVMKVHTALHGTLACSTIVAITTIAFLYDKRTSFAERGEIVRLLPYVLVLTSRREL